MSRRSSLVGGGVQGARTYRPCDTSFWHMGLVFVVVFGSTLTVEIRRLRLFSGFDKVPIGTLTWVHIFEVTVVTVHFFVVTLNSNGNRLTPMDFSFTTETDTTTGAPVVTK